MTSSRTAARDLPCPDWLSVKPIYELDVRVFRLGKVDPFVGVAVNVHTRKRILATCDVLLGTSWSWWDFTLRASASAPTTV